MFTLINCLNCQIMWENLIVNITGLKNISYVDCSLKIHQRVIDFFQRKTLVFTAGIHRYLFHFQTSLVAADSFMKVKSASWNKGPKHERPNIPQNSFNFVQESLYTDASNPRPRQYALIPKPVKIISVIETGP